VSSISQFMERNYKHFNAREMLAAAKAWRALLAEGGEMFLAMAGAMSTAEIGISLAEMIRQEKVHAVCCTAANLEEDLFNLFANREYRMVPDYRALTADDEVRLRDNGYNRVTDTCIPFSVMQNTDDTLVEMWSQAAEAGTPRFWWEYFYELFDRPEVPDLFQIPPEHSWVLAAKQRNLPIYTPGVEDSTLGASYCAAVMRGQVSNHHAVKTGTQQLEHLTHWYLERVKRKTPVGFFQIGGGIAGDFSICTVPMIIEDLKKDVPFWAYFAQISDSTTSYGSYSGAVPNEKITWHKLNVNTPRFMINSDASIVAPLIFSYVLGQ